jgi:hypothetical protein
MNLHLRAARQQSPASSGSVRAAAARWLFRIITHSFPSLSPAAAAGGNVEYDRAKM